MSQVLINKLETGTLNQEDLKELLTSQGLSQKTEEKRSISEIDNAINKMVETEEKTEEKTGEKVLILREYKSLTQAEKDNMLAGIEDIKTIVNIPVSVIPAIIECNLMTISEIKHKFRLNAFNPENMPFSRLFYDISKLSCFVWEEEYAGQEDKILSFCNEIKIVNNNKSGTQRTITFNAITSCMKKETFTIRQKIGKTGTSYSPVMKSDVMESDARLKLNQVFKGKDKISNPKQELEEKVNTAIGVLFKELTDYNTFQNDKEDIKKGSKQIEKTFNNLYGFIKAIRNS